MKDQLYKIMKQAGDPTVFTKMVNEVAQKIQEEEAAAEQRSVNLDEAREKLSIAAINYCMQLFNIKESHAGESDEMVDQLYDMLVEVEPEILESIRFMEDFKSFMKSKAPVELKHNTCSCGGDCKCKEKSNEEDVASEEETIDIPKVHIEVHKVPVHEDIDVDTVIREFLKSLQ